MVKREKAGSENVKGPITSKYKNRQLSFYTPFNCMVIIIRPGFCPESKSIGTNGPLSLKKVGHFRKYGALVNFHFCDDNSLSAFRQVEKT